MNQERLMQVLLSPHITEKAATIESSNQHIFKVLPDASKREVKAAVEAMFDVKVEEVRLLNVKGKRKTFRQTPGKRSDWKKAYIKLAAGQDIDLGVAE